MFDRGSSSEDPSATDLFKWLDELKVAVCAAPDGQYCRKGGKYGQAGIVQEHLLDGNLQKSEKSKKWNNDSIQYVISTGIETHYGITSSL